MTKKNALTIVSQTIDACDLSSFTDDQQNAIKTALDVVSGMIDQLSAPRHVSDDTKARANAKRKNDTAVARAELVAKVAPVLRKYLASDITAKDLYEAAKDELPADFTAPKVQNVLLREMKDELVKTEAKGKANTYRLK